jgi:class 3 adenylate cyclase
MGEQAAYIIIQGPGHNDTRVALREGITSFGRLPSNDVILLGDLVSRHHARIIYFDGRASLQDLGSHNGSWVNEERVTTRALSPSDQIRIGNFRITFRKGELGAEDEAFVVEATRDDHSSGPPPAAETAPPRSHSRAGVRLRAPSVSQEPPEGYGARKSGQSAMVRELGQFASGDHGESSGTLLLLYRVTEALTRAASPSDYFEQVLGFTLERIPAEAAVLFRVTADQADPTRELAIGPATAHGEPQVSMSAVRWTVAKSFTVYSKNVTADLRFRNTKSTLDLDPGLRAVVCSPITLQDRVLGALYLARSEERPFTEQEVDVVEAICHLAAVGMERLDSRQRAVEEGIARLLLARAHSPDVVERIMHESGPEQTPRRFLEARAATVLFCGVQGFGSVSEQLPNEQVSEFLSVYLDEMSARIFAHRGTFHQLLGDEFVAVFGAPYSYGNDAIRSISAALDMRARFDRLVSQRPHLGPIRLSTGVASGRLLAGAVGPSRRLDYTVLGEPVRLAARIRALAPPGTIMIGAATLPAIEERFETRLAGRKPLRPRHDPEDVFEVTGLRTDESRTSLE